MSLSMKAHWADTVPDIVTLPVNTFTSHSHTAHTATTTLKYTHSSPASNAKTQTQTATEGCTEIAMQAEIDKLD